MHITCSLCGTDAPDRVYYVGADDSWCADCWLVQYNKLMSTQINFNTDAVVESIDSQLKKSRESGPLDSNPKPEAETIQVKSVAAAFVGGANEYNWFNRGKVPTPHYNYGTDRP